ncbi:uncharacterized protein LOC144129319 [Amblyomma americanum]
MDDPALQGPGRQSRDVRMDPVRVRHTVGRRGRLGLLQSNRDEANRPSTRNNGRIQLSAPPELRGHRRRPQDKHTVADAVPRQHRISSGASSRLRSASRSGSQAMASIFPIDREKGRSGRKVILETVPVATGGEEAVQPHAPPKLFTTKCPPSPCTQTRRPPTTELGPQTQRANHASRRTRKEDEKEKKKGNGRCLEHCAAAAFPLPREMRGSR